MVTAMATTVGTSSIGTRAGRPPRINRAMIAEAAHDIGLEGLTLKAVADHLGVTTAALYHYVDSKDDLLRAAAEHSTQAFPHPVDNGQNWAQWLLDWANYNRAVFSAQPGLLGQYLDGAIPLENVVRDLDLILSVLVREGFTVAGANAAYSVVSSCALGTMLSEQWEQASTRDTGGVVATYRGVVDAAPKRNLTFIRELLYAKDAQRPTFEDRIETVLRGIALEQGLRWKAIVRHDSPTDDDTNRR